MKFLSFALTLRHSLSPYAAAALLSLLWCGCELFSPNPKPADEAPDNETVPVLITDRSKWRWQSPPDIASASGAAISGKAKSNVKSALPSGNGELLHGTEINGGKFDSQKKNAKADKPKKARKEEPLKRVNLIVNGGFELGTAGFDCIRMLRCDTNSKLVFDPPEVDFDCSASGQSSLRLTHRFAEATKLIATEVELEREKEYKFSGKLKSDRDGVIVAMTILAIRRYPGQRSQTDTHSVRFSLSPKWKEFEFTFTTGKFDTYQIVFETNSTRRDATTATVWFDDLKLREPETLGRTKSEWENFWNTPTTADDPWFSLPDTEPAGDTGRRVASSDGVGAVFKPDRDLYVASPKNAGTFSVNGMIANLAKHALNVEIELELHDDFSGKFCKIAEMKCYLNPAEQRRHTWKFPLPRSGAYTLIPRLKVKNEPTTAIPAAFAVVEPVAPSRALPGTRFELGLNSGGSTGFVLNDDPKANSGFRARGVGADEYYRRLALTGCRTLREWAGTRRVFSWSAVEKQPGKFDFAAADRLCELTGRHGIALLPVLGGMEFMASTDPSVPLVSLPEWMFRNTSRQDYIPNFFKPVNAWVYLPRLQYWQRYIKAAATNFKGKINCVEILQEPNAGGGRGWLPYEVYLKYFNAAVAEIRTATPDCRIIGFCVTGGLDGYLLEYLADCLKTGALANVDAVSFHPYQARELECSREIDGDAAKFLRDLRALVDRHAGKRRVPLWNTELEYLFNYDVALELRQAEYLPRHLIRRLCTDLGEGVDFSSPVGADSLFRRTVLDKLMSFEGIGRTATVPSVNFVAANVFSRLLSGASPTGKFLRDGGAAYTYSGKGRNIAVLWSFDNTPEYHKPCPFAPEEVDLFDLMGNPVEIDRPASGPASIAVGPNPVYIVRKTADAAKFAKWAAQP